MMILPIGKSNFIVHKRNTRVGTTIIEVMISIAVLSIGLVLILQGFLQCLNYLRISEDNLKTSLVAGNKMAEVQIQAKEDWDALEKGSNERFKFEGLKYIWDVEVGDVIWDAEEIPQSYEDLREVKTSLSWEEGKRKGAIFLVTYMRSPH